MEIPSSDILRKLTYSELKKVAKTHGIKVNMKAEKIISSLLSMTSDSSDDLDCFTTPSQKLMNSSRKNKENKFNEDKMTSLDTPRRGTYSLESSSVSILVNKIEDASSFSPAVDILNASNITVGRGSERTLRSRKVAFVTPTKITPSCKYLSLKDRPKTPVASRMSGGRITFSTPAQQKSQEQIPVIQVISPSLDSKATKFLRSSGRIKTDASQTTSLKQNETPKKKSGTKTATSNNCSAAKLKRKDTPNFKKIHQKAFDKMESIDDYQKRKILHSAKKLQLSQSKPKQTKVKSRIPVAFSGIPFIPSKRGGCSTKVNCPEPDLKNVFPPTLTRNCSHLKAEGKQKIRTANENVPLKGKAKFDLKASLSRKLGYIPYSGPLKPLAESNSTNKPCFHNEKGPVNKVVKANRSQTRSVLQGVRVNKRFALQMKNRQ